MKHRADARDFLQTAWQVQAAAVGFSLTVAVFGLQAAGSDRWRATPRELARATWADVVLALGVVSTLITGLALAGAGAGGPEGWSGTVAVVVGAGSLASVLALWATSIRVMAGGAFRHMRVREIERAVERSVDRAVRERIALNLLSTFATEMKVEFSPMDFGLRRGTAVLAGGAGHIVDIKMARLARLASKHPGEFKIRAYLGLACGPSTVVGRLSDGSRLAPKDLQSCFEIRRVQDTGVDAGFALLHSLAMHSIAGNDALAFEEVRTAYRESLKIYPEAWSKFGRSFDHDAANGLTPFALPVLSDVQRNLTRQIAAAAQVSRDELLADAAWLPGLVALDAAALQADALFAAMLDVLVRADSELARNDPTGTDGRLLRRVLMECIDYGPAARLRSEDDTLADRLAAAELVDAAYVRVANSAKLLLDLDRSEDLGWILNRWSECLRFFDPDPDPLRWQVEQLARQGLPDPSLDQAADDLEQLRGTSERLNRFRTSLMLQLLGWEVHRLSKSSGAPNTAAPMLVRSLPEDLDRLFEFAADDRTGSELSTWILFARPESENGGAYDSYGPLIDAMAIAGIFRTDHDAAPLLTPTPLLMSIEDRLVASVNRMVVAWSWDVLIPERNERKRADNLIRAITQAAAESRRQHEQDVVAQPLVPERVEAFVHTALDAVRKTRIVPRWLGSSAASSPRLPGSEPEFIGADEVLPKEWFQANAPFDVSEIARQVGQSAARNEEGVLLRHLVTVDRTPFAGHAGDAIRHAIAQLRQRGWDPNVAFTARSWKLLKQIREAGLDTATRGGPHGGPDFLGTFDGVEIRQSEIIPNNVVVVADLTEAITWRPTLVLPERDELVASVAVRDPAEVAALAAKDHTWFRVSAEDGLDERVLRALQKVDVRVRMAAYISIQHETAVMAFVIPSEAEDGSRSADTSVVRAADDGHGEEPIAPTLVAPLDHRRNMAGFATIRLRRGLPVARYRRTVAHALIELRNLCADYRPWKRMRARPDRVEQ